MLPWKLVDVACMITCSLYCALFETSNLHYCCCCLAVHLVNLNSHFHQAHTLSGRIYNLNYGQDLQIVLEQRPRCSSHVKQVPFTVIINGLNLLQLHYCYIQARKQLGSYTCEHSKLNTHD